MEANMKSKSHQHVTSNNLEHRWNYHLTLVLMLIFGGVAYSQNENPARVMTVIFSVPLFVLANMAIAVLSPNIKILSSGKNLQRPMLSGVAFASTMGIVLVGGDEDYYEIITRFIFHAVFFGSCMALAPVIAHQISKNSQ